MADASASEAAPHPHATAPNLDLNHRLWKAARRWTSALVVALFPLLFILDERTDLSFSPVLPGLLALALLIVLLPFGLAELFSRRARHRPAETRERQGFRNVQWAGIALVAALLVFLAWLALGA
ncbi:MAG TPA: hypothetical protein VI796_04935 [Candidatus Thermoplasmatota archaeon]|nr:hypothetical protein [Candidatus Thermoplasmatota archaeon]